MNIIHAIIGLGRAAGTTVFCARLAEEQAKAGHRVAVVVNWFNDEYCMTPRGCEVIVWKPGDELPFKPDVIHIHAIWSPWLHKVHVLAHRIGAKVALSPHGMLSPWAMAHKRWKKIIPWHLYQKKDVACAEVIHTTAPQETQWVRNLGFSNSIIEAPLGADLPNDVAKFNNPVKDLLFVGRIYPVKGLDYLIRAWNKTDTTGWRLRLVGPDQAGHAQELKALCKSDNIEFVGPVYGNELQNVYSSARAFILPSYTENFGGVVVDAMSHALPVLTSEATPWNFLQDKQCGFHFATNEESLIPVLQKVMAMPDNDLLRMGDNGRNLVKEKYSWSSVAQKTIDGYCSRNSLPTN